MDMETARAMLQLLLGRQWRLYGQFNNFLEQSKYKVINKDQWCNILEFSRSIQSDLSNYDVDGACKSFHPVYKDMLFCSVLLVNNFPLVCLLRACDVG